MYREVTEALRSAEQQLCREVALHFLRVLENGDYLGHPYWMHLLGEEARERFRALRRQLCERDVYELLYGELPSGVVEPEFRGDPWASTQREE